jgi:hypothetical protein
MLADDCWLRLTSALQWLAMLSAAAFVLLE